MDSSARPAGDQFPTTRWSLVLGGAAAGPDAEHRRAALEALARTYWRPIHAYVRSRTGKSIEDSKDLAQDFFLHLLESDLVARADPSRGRFRAFVKVALRNFLTDSARRALAAKRGGGRAVVRIDADDAPFDIEDGAARSPEEILDDAWRAELLARATEELEAVLRDEDAETVFAVFRDYVLDGDEVDHATLAARHGIERHTVSNHLQRAKRRYREVLRALVAETTGGDLADLDDELRWLLGRSGD